MSSSRPNQEEWNKTSDPPPRNLEILGAPKVPIILLSAALYGLVHIIYRDPLTLVLTLLLGIIWGFGYYRARNLLGVSISHAILGALTILTGIID